MGQPDHLFDPARPDGVNPSIDHPIAPCGVPELGERYLLPARQGRAVRLEAGQYLTIVNIHGTQVCDFWTLAADDLRECLSMPHQHGVHSRITIRAGDTLMSNRRKALMTLVDDTSPGQHDTVVAACDVYRYRQLGAAHYHDNCTDNFRMALKAIAIEPGEIPAPLNIWMNTPVGSDGAISWLPPTSRPGDRVVLRAERAVIAVMSACPQDMVPINGADNLPKELAFMVTAEQPAP